MTARLTCQRRHDSPQKWHRKIPQSGWLTISLGVIGACMFWRPASTFGLGQEQIGVLAEAIARPFDLDHYGVVKVSRSTEAAVEMRIIAPLSFPALTNWKKRSPEVTGR